MSIKQGDEVWGIEFFPNVGSEIGRKRPVLVINSDLIGKLPLKTIPITEWSKTFTNYPWIVNILKSSLNDLLNKSSINCFQMRNFSINRFIKKIGITNEKSLFTVDETIAKTLNPKYKLI